MYLSLSIAFICLNLISAATPIKFDDEQDDDGEMIRNMFKGIRSMITGLQPSQHSNGTTHRDLNIESDASFVYPNHAKMREMIEQNMAGAENTTGVKMSGGLAKNEDKHIEMQGGDLSKGEEIGCSGREECNKTSYCNKLTYTCEACHQEGGTCFGEEECCDGYTCDAESNNCKKKKGNDGESCSRRDDCRKDFCCALNDDGEGICQPYLKEGEDCSRDPFTSFFATQSLFLRDSIAGLPNKCPCHRDLKCERKRSLIFMESEVCLKAIEKKTDHKAFIKITFKTSPMLKFQSGNDMEDMPSLPSLLPSFFPKESTSSMRTHVFQKLPRPSHRGGFTMRFSRIGHKSKKPSRISFQKSPLSFLRFHNPFDDGEEEIDQIKEKLKKKREMKRAKRTLVNGVGEEARESVHRAVDGIFDTIMKKLSVVEKKE